MNAYYQFLHFLDKSGNSPLTLAAKCGARAHCIMRLLLDAGADVNIQDGDQRTALHYCAAKAKGVDLLLSRGADPNIQDKDGNAAIHLAATEGFSTVIRCLLDYKCNPDIRNSFGKTAMHYITMKNHVESIDDIIGVGGDLNMIDCDGKTPLWYAVYRNRPEAVKAMLKGNCDLNSIKSLGDSPLMVALEMNLFKIAKLLVLAGSCLKPLHQYMSSSSLDDLNGEDKDDANWLRDWLRVPHSLRQHCRIHIRKYIGYHPISKEHGLQLPQSLRDYITLQEVDDHI